MRAGLVALATLCAACTHQYEGAVSMTPRPHLSAVDYADVLDRWTRRDRVYNGLHTVIFADATFHSPEFRVAFLSRHKDVYGRGSEEARRLALTSEDAEEGLEFFVSAWTPKEGDNELEDADSIWRLTLEGEGGARVDGVVRRIKTSANIRVIYPYVTDFARTYAVRFPRATLAGGALITPSTERLVLRITSAIGEAEMVWQLGSDQVAAP